MGVWCRIDRAGVRAPRPYTSTSCDTVQLIPLRPSPNMMSLYPSLFHLLIHYTDTVSTRSNLSYEGSLKFNGSDVKLAEHVA